MYPKKHIVNVNVEAQRNVMVVVPHGIEFVVEISQHFETSSVAAGLAE